MTYPEEAAAELRKARDTNEGLVPLLVAGSLPTADILREINARRIEIADGFIRLAAIEAGLPPHYHVRRPGQE